MLIGGYHVCYGEILMKNFVDKSLSLYMSLIWHILYLDIPPHIVYNFSNRISFDIPLDLVTELRLIYACQGYNQLSIKEL